MSGADPHAVFRGLRVCLVGPAPPPAGGMALQTLQLAELLKSEGACVEHIPTNAPYPWPWVAQLPHVRALFRLIPYAWRLWAAIGRNQLVHLMANSGWSWHLFCVPAIWLAWFRGVPVVVNYRGGEAESFMRRHAGLVRFTLRRASALIVPSGFLQRVFGKFSVPAEIVPNIVDLDRFKPLGLRPAIGEERRYVLVARNLEHIYDNASAIEAFAIVAPKLPDVDLVIAGTGPLEGDLREQAESLGLAARIRFTGRLDRDAMTQALQRAAVALNPSLVDNTPNSLLEAMACGIPIVSTNVGGVPFLVKHDETAFLVPPRNPRAMAEALTRLLEDRELSKQLAREGLSHVHSFSWSRVKSSLAACYGALPIRSRAKEELVL